MTVLQCVTRICLVVALTMGVIAMMDVGTALAAGPNWKICKSGGTQESPPCDANEKPVELPTSVSENVEAKGVSGERGVFALVLGATEVKCLKTESINTVLIGGKPGKDKGRLLFKECSVVAKSGCKVRSAGKAVNSNEVETSALVTELVYDGTTVQAILEEAPIGDIYKPESGMVLAGFTFEGTGCPANTSAEGCVLGEVVHPDTYAVKQSINFPSPAKTGYLAWLKEGEFESRECKLTGGGGAASMVGEEELVLPSGKKWGVFAK